MKHRCNIAWGRFNDHRKSLTAGKLPTHLRTHLYRTLVVSTMAYGSSAWMFTDSMRKKINGVNSKMLAQITRRTFHDEAKTPSFDTVDHILSRRWEYLGHILRLDDERALKKFVTKLSPEFPFQEGSLLWDTSFSSIGEVEAVAVDRKLWREERQRKSRVG